MKRHARLNKADRKRAGKQAAKNPTWVTVAASILYQRPVMKFTSGAASECRQIMKNGKLLVANDGDRKA